MEFTAKIFVMLFILIIIWIPQTGFGFLKKKLT